MQSQDLIQRIQGKTAVIGVVGLGYVGLPLVSAFCRKGFSVVGLDIDAEKIAKLKRRESYIKHISAASIGELMSTGRFSPTTEFKRIGECDAVLLCVPTPLNKNREPDMSYIQQTARSIAPHMRKGQLIVLESTTYPGTTHVLLASELGAGSHLTAGDDYFLAYSPEREDPGSAFETSRIPKVVGGLTPACREVASALYSAAMEKVVPVSSTQVAEMTKLFENIFRSVNIALVNELKMLCDRMGLDVWEVIEASATKPFGFMPFYPGPGLGGHCIPIDPFYLTWKAREFDMTTRFIELAGEINTQMPEYVVRRTAHALNLRKKALNGSRILLLGIAYKRNVDDMRESPAIKILELLRAEGCDVCYHDGFVPSASGGHHDLQLESQPLTDQLLATVDAVMIVTDHSDIDYARVVEKAQLVIDTRNATRNVTRGRDRVFKT
jgi:UDP-N-acetyl-D-glucosamine dehydrogenase